MSKRWRRGFTLIELMIVVAIIGILAAISIPKFATTLQKAREASTKDHLGAVRSALTVYYAENDGVYPRGPNGDNTTFLQTILTSKYLKEWYSVSAPPYHDETNTVDSIDTDDWVAADPSDDGEWMYIASSNHVAWGTLKIECYHTDTGGRYWTDY